MIELVWYSSFVQPRDERVQWMDKEGKTPLIVACLRHDLVPVAKALIDLGANVNAYRPGETFKF